MIPILDMSFQPRSGSWPLRLMAQAGVIMHISILSQVSSVERDINSPRLCLSMHCSLGYRALRGFRELQEMMVSTSMVGM